MGQGIFNKSARSGWEPETIVLGMPHGAAIGSWLRSALAPVGSGLPEDLFAKIETHVVGVAGRRVTGLPR